MFVLPTLLPARGAVKEDTLHLFKWACLYKQHVFSVVITSQRIIQKKSYCTDCIHDSPSKSIIREGMSFQCPKMIMVASCLEVAGKMTTLSTWYL